MQIFLSFFLFLIVTFFFAATFRAYNLSKKSVALIQKYQNQKNNPQLIKDIFSTISKDFFLRRILNKHNATIYDIAKLHKKLLKWGDFRKYNRYVPITSFFNRTTLDYLLSHKNDDAKSLTTKMMNHFHF